MRGHSLSPPHVFVGPIGTDAAGLPPGFDAPRLSWNKRPVSFNAILDVRRLTKSYPNGAGTLTVVKDISFSLPAGSTCAILGPSGSGKTTLLGLCAGLDQPTDGEVRLDRIDLGPRD